jgi:hypothetical protein
MNCLIQQDDLFSAQSFVEQTYANLKDIKNGMDQEGEQVSTGAYNLADVIQRQNDGDLIKAEKLARESFRIRTQFCDTNHCSVGENCLLSARILLKQREVAIEVKELFERSLANYIRNEGMKGQTELILQLYSGLTSQYGKSCSSFAHTKRVCRKKLTSIFKIRNLKGLL